MEYVIGLDIGSSSAKVGLFTLDGESIAITRRCYPTHEPFPGYKEQDPELWWTAVCEGLREVTRGIGRDEVAALGATGHISSFTFVDRAGRPLRPAVGFQDQRALAELAELYACFSREELAAHLGIDLPPAATWPLPKLLWFKKHEPAMMEGAHHVLQAKDFINLRLTGEFASDASSNRGIVDLSNGGVSKAVLSRFDLRQDLLPRLYDPERVIGVVCRDAAKETGLRHDLPVVAGWNDLNASVLGCGAVSEGDTFNITGTSDHIGVVTGADHNVPELMCAPFLPARKLLYGVTSCGGGSLDWYAALSGRNIEELLALAASAPPVSDPLLFLPYLEGERSPIWDPCAAGAFVGIRSAHKQGHFVRAILEGVAFSLKQILELVERHAGENRGAIVVPGGAARTALWNRIKADVLDRAIAVPRNLDAGIQGAAMLAAVGAGRYRDCDQAARAMGNPAQRIDPRDGSAARYRLAYSQYCALYPALRSVFSRLHADRFQTTVNPHD